MMSICLFFSVAFFGGNLLTGIFLIRFLIPRWSSGHPFCSFPCFACDYLQTGYSDMLDISYLFNNNTLPKLVFPYGVKNTPKIAIFRMCYGENGTMKFFETLADNVFRHSYSMMQINKKLNDGKILG